ncbi:MAG TPA: ATP-binding protein, partial [Cyclobacteriaceae bacterium]|nr:ATP-binding protein [Cyclobacteriaceae bacterium]
PLVYNWQQILRYTYFLKGLDKEWQYTTSERREIHYTNLDPGDYVLKVKASFDGKNWPSETAEIKIHVTPPWWATIWFRSGSLLIIVLSFYGFYKTRISFLKTQGLKLEGLVENRTFELKNSNREIRKLLNEVDGQKKQIEDQYQELRQVNEELESQRDTLELRGAELEKAQSKLKAINANLELLVDKRTQKLSNTVRELETFLYRASHDLKGPISSMQGLINAAALENDPGKFAKEYSEFMVKTVLRLDRTLYKLLQKHTIERRKISYDTFAQDGLTTLLDEIRPDIPSFRSQDFNLVFQDNIEIRADKMMLSIILANLLENAFFFSTTAVDKKVVLEIRKDGKITIMTVTDHGPGIKPELKERIFTMFYRGSELSSGNGLGLYLVKGALDKMNGKIELETLEGSYSTFTITL